MVVGGFEVLLLVKGRRLWGRSRKGRQTHFVGGVRAQKEGSILGAFKGGERWFANFVPKGRGAVGWWSMMVAVVDVVG